MTLPVPIAGQTMQNLRPLTERYSSPLASQRGQQYIPRQVYAQALPQSDLEADDVLTYPPTFLNISASKMITSYSVSALQDGSFPTWASSSRSTMPGASSQDLGTEARTIQDIVWQNKRETDDVVDELRARVEERFTTLEATLSSNVHFATSTAATLRDLSERVTQFAELLESTYKRVFGNGSGDQSILQQVNKLRSEVTELAADLSNEKAQRKIPAGAVTPSGTPRGDIKVTKLADGSTTVCVQGSETAPEDLPASVLDSGSPKSEQSEQIVRLAMALVAECTERQQLAHDLKLLTSEVSCLREQVSSTKEQMQSAMPNQAVLDKVWRVLSELAILPSCEDGESPKPFSRRDGSLPAESTLPIQLQGLPRLTVPDSPEDMSLRNGLEQVERALREVQEQSANNQASRAPYHAERNAKSSQFETIPEEESPANIAEAV